MSSRNQDRDRPLRILYLEASTEDAARALATLERSGIAAHTDVTGAREEFEQLLGSSDHDVILTAGRVGSYTASGVLETLDSAGSATPVVVVTDYSSEEETARYFEEGAADIVYKDRLALLSLTVERVVRERRLRRARERAELALRSVNQVLTALIRCAPLPITVIDEAGKVNVWNPAAEEVLGWGRDEILGNTLREVIGTENGLGALMERARHKGGVIGAEVSQSRKDGAMVDLRVFCAPLTDDDDQTQGVVGMLTDVTERNLIIEAFRESKERFQSAFMYAPIGIAISSLDGRILRVNSAFCKMLGYSESSLLRMGWEDLVHPDDRQQVNPGDNKDSAERQIRFRHKAGRAVHVQWSTSIVRDAAGRPQYRIGQVVDITESKRAEERIHRYAQDLERSNRDLQHFAYVASHDLQEPLRMIRGFVELLARRYEGKLGADADEYIHYAVDGATRMQNLIRGLLAYSRVGTQGKSLEAIETGDALRQSLLNLKAATEDTGAEVTHDPMPVAPADGTQLAQLFQNLIGNALKFRGEEPPKIHVGVDDMNDVWRFAVKDNGIGFDPQHANRIFQMFQRLHGPTKYSGTGIGLAVCKRIVERHGGQIWVESAPGRGSTFYFTIPKEAEAA